MLPKFAGLIERRHGWNVPVAAWVRSAVRWPRLLYIAPVTMTSFGNAGLVIVLPFLTKKRTQCAYFCPFGAFQSIFNKINLFEIRFDREKCVDCTLCQTACPIMALSAESIREGKTLMNCMKCGACVDSCKKSAAVWHLKGTKVALKPERARLLFLYGAWAMATMFGGSILANSIATMLHWLPVK